MEVDKPEPTIPKRKKPQHATVNAPEEGSEQSSDESSDEGSDEGSDENRMDEAVDIFQSAKAHATLSKHKSFKQVIHFSSQIV